jgi:hypothetical protein
MRENRLETVAPQPPPVPPPGTRKKPPPAKDGASPVQKTA